MQAVISSINQSTEAYVRRFIDPSRHTALCDTNLSFPDHITVHKHTGKVRDVYLTDTHVVIVTTDRLSAFDRCIASVPYKGQVLNMISMWWFSQMKSVVPNHIVACPHPNIAICRKCKVFPIEFVVRGFITGTTSTSMWTNYAKGVRDYCGHHLPEGLVKNQRLDRVLLTPTTKDDSHDELISAAEVVASGRMAQEEWDVCSDYAMRLFRDSQEKALERGLILVDTKYEFGRCELTGEILLVDELQTPDSSRYWLAHSYEGRVSSGKEPENIDKEFLRRWYTEMCDPYEDIQIPEAPLELISELARRYIMLFEVITGERMQFCEYDKLQQDMNVAICRFFESSATA